MVTSINTNPPAFTGLQNLNQTSNLLGKNQKQISTGLRVSGPRDNAAIFAISQALQGEIAGVGAVQGALRTGSSTVSVAITAGQEVGDLLTDLKSVAVRASQDGLDASSRQALETEFNALRDQINTVVGSASFGGTNLVEAGAQDLAILSDAGGGTITVTGQDLSSSGLGLDTLTLGSSADALNAVASIDAAITQASSGLAELGAAANRVEDQAEFSTQLQNILQEGVGNLIDADLGETAAQNQALTIKDQLGVQALSIANAGPTAILALFR